MQEVPNILPMEITLFIQNIVLDLNFIVKNADGSGNSVAITTSGRNIHSSYSPGGNSLVYVRDGKIRLKDLTVADILSFAV